MLMPMEPLSILVELGWNDPIDTICMLDHQIYIYVVEMKFVVSQCHRFGCSNILWCIVASDFPCVFRSSLGYFPVLVCYCFYARQHICYSAYKPWQFRPSVCLSVTRVDQSKTVEARITQFSPYSSPIPLVFRG